MAGRKPKLTPEVQHMICTGISAGLPKKAACAAVGVSESAFYEWLQRGEEDIEKCKKSLYAEFVEQIKKSESAFQLTHLTRISKAGQEGNWQADAWLLERCFPKEYGRQKMDVELTGNDGGPVKTESVVQIYIPSNGREKKDNE